MQKLRDYLNANFESWALEIRIHATKRMYQRNISSNDLHHVLNHGLIIEEYETDYPFPSVLLNGKSEVGRPIHIVVGVDSDEQRLYIITVYEPDIGKWLNDFSRRSE